MTPRLEVFADITCPFAHVGLRKVAGIAADLAPIVRAWPLEWVNDEPLTAEAVGTEIDALRTQLGVDAFAGFDPHAWPSSTVPALNLAASAYAIDAVAGFRVSLAVRDALFEEGLDVSDPTVLSRLAARHGLDPPSPEPAPSVEADYTEGIRRGVRGSPDFWIDSHEFFCPALTVGHDDAGLTVAFDDAGLEDFLRRVETLS